MRRFAQVLIVIVLGATLLPAALAAPRTPSPREEFVPDEVLVQFKPGIRPDVVAASVGARVEGPIGTLDVFVLKVPAGSVRGTVNALSRNPLVEFAEANGYVHAFVVPQDPNDPYDNTGCVPTSDGACRNQWAWARVQAYDAWGITTGSPTVRVAVVDTGIDVGDPYYPWGPDPQGHPDIVSCQSVIIASFVQGETGNDDDGHGTHVAGTIGACTNNGIGVAGANWQVQLMGVKVLDYSGSGTYKAVASGINWAVNNGAKVINLSLGGGPSRTMERAVNNAWQKGAVLACAAGNSGNTARQYPAAYTNCIAVAATDASDSKASFSSYGASWVDVAAPGVNIVSTMQDEWTWCFLCYWYGYYEGYDALSGTSMAAPHVAGLAALVWASGLCPANDNACVRQRIENTADSIAGTGTYWAKGRVNYFKAVSP